MRNPFAKTHDPDRPRPGGIDGTVVDHVYWYPPAIFRWGQGFDHPFTNVPAANGGRWINEFLPDKNYEMPWGVDEVSHIWPAIYGTDGRFSPQLQGGSPGPPVGPVLAKAMDAFSTAQSKVAAGWDAWAGGFARS